VTKFGVVFPQTQIAPDPGAARAYAVAAAELGYDHLLAYDHVVGAIPALHPGWNGGYTDAHTFHEPLVFFGFLAATCPLELVTGILISPQRQTVLIAKQAAELDVLTGGRFRLGIGVGWNSVEFQALGADFRTRGRHIEEQVALMRALWRGPVERFDGEFHTVTGVVVVPPPTRSQIPVWMGANSVPRALARIGRLADGWIVQGQPGPDLDRDAAHVFGALADSGRGQDSFGVQGRVNVGGKDADWTAARVAAWEEFGATHIAVNTMMKEPVKSVDDHIRMLEKAASVLFNPH
jgi:probable F420-dependent oxidoreductase